MDKIIIYGSQYGTTERYAGELSKRTGIKALSYEAVKDLSMYDTIIYLGGLYAGGVLGLAKTIKLLPKDSKQTILIVTVGLADPNDKKNTDDIKLSLQKQIPKDIYERAKIFHIRGGIDYQKLSFKHRTMMKLLYMIVKRRPPEKQTAETKEMIDTYNQTVNFVDFESLKDVIDSIPC
jgi:menaquinone-dependent protoporphyrinogen IX oxidase